MITPAIWYFTSIKFGDFQNKHKKKKCPNRSLRGHNILTSRS